MVQVVWKFCLYVFDGTYFATYKSEKIVYVSDAVSAIHEVPDSKSQSQ